MHRIIIDDVELKDVIVLSLGEEQICGLNYETLTVYGRNGKIYSSNESYKGYTRTIKLLISDRSKVDTVMDKIVGINKKIQFSDNEKFYFYYTFLDEIIIEKLRDKIILNIDLKIYPFKYFIENKVFTLTRNSTAENIGNVFCEPKITIFGNGSTSFSLGRQTMRFNIDEKLVIECKHGEQNLYDKDGNVANSRLLGGSFFEVPPGLRGVVLGAGITRVEIEMRCRNR